MATNRKALAGKCEGLPRIIKPGRIDTQEHSPKARDFQVFARGHLLQTASAAGHAAFAEIARGNSRDATSLEGIAQHAALALAGKLQ